MANDATRHRLCKYCNIFRFRVRGWLGTGIKGESHLITYMTLDSNVIKQVFKSIDHAMIFIDIIGG